MKGNFLPNSPGKPVGMKWEQILCHVKSCKSTVTLKFTLVVKAYIYTYRSSGMVLIVYIWKFAYEMRKLYIFWRNFDELRSERRRCLNYWIWLTKNTQHTLILLISCKWLVFKSSVCKLGSFCCPWSSYCYLRFRAAMQTLCFQAILHLM